ELLGGRTLAQQVREGGAIAPDRVLLLARQMAAGLAEAHRKGIVHRDFKSANVLLEGDPVEPRVVVTDFGLARSLSSGETSAGPVGTPGYMAPEQIVGGAVGPRTDVYAFGVVLLEMLTGRGPDDRTRPLWSRPRAELDEMVAPLPPAWRPVVLRCLAA